MLHYTSLVKLSNQKNILPVWFSAFFYSQLGINSELYKIEQQLVLIDQIW